MILRRSLNEPAVMIRIGSASFLLASLSRWFIHPSADFWRGLADGATGLLLGITIACYLIAVRLRTRTNNPGNSCA
jgi:hypothetical protein